MNLENELPTVVQLICAMVEAQTEGDAANIRTLAFFTANFVRHALSVYASFRAMFAQKETMSSREYTAQNQNPVPNHSANATVPQSQSSTPPASTPNAAPPTPGSNSTTPPSTSTTTEAPATLTLPVLNTVANSEPARTVELYPGRRLIRARMTFKNETGLEAHGVCQKDYRHSLSHSPGLFTVQCA